MAQDWIFADNALAMVKTETTYRTDSAPSAATNAVYVRNVVVKPTQQMIDKQRKASHHISPGKIPGRKNVSVEFEVPLPGLNYTDPATTPIGTPDWEPLLLAAGFDVTVSALDSVVNDNARLYKPTTFRAGSGQSSFTLDFLLFRDGANLAASSSGVEIWKATGCVLSVEYGFSSGDECVLKFTGMGCWEQTPQDYTGDLSAITYQAFEDSLVAQGATLLDVGGNSDVVSDIQINMNWEVKERTSMSGLNGVEGFMITRKGSITGSMNVEGRLESARGRWADVEAATGLEFDMAIMTPQGVGIRVEMPNVQLDSPDPNFDGVLNYSQPFCARDLDASTFDSQFGLLITTLGGASAIEDAAYEIFS